MFDAQGLFTELYDWITQTNPQAQATVSGQKGDEGLSGVVYFYQTEMGALLIWSIGGLPVDNKSCGNSIFAIHIHEGKDCPGAFKNREGENPPAQADLSVGGHYNPYDCPHPYHAGDLPPLFSNGGYAFGAVLTSRFGVEEVIGRTVAVHSGADDFTSQPSGKAGEIIGCGVIQRLP